MLGGSGFDRLAGRRPVCELLAHESLGALLRSRPTIAGGRARERRGRLGLRRLGRCDLLLFKLRCRGGGRFRAQRFWHDRIGRNRFRRPVPPMPRNVEAVISAHPMPEFIITKLARSRSAPVAFSKSRAPDSIIVAVALCHAVYVALGSRYRQSASSNEWQSPTSHAREHPWNGPNDSVGSFIGRERFDQNYLIKIWWRRAHPS